MENKFIALATQAPSSTWMILGNPATRAFEVFPLLRPPQEAMTGRGFEFIGVCAIVEGKPQTKFCGAS